MGFEIRLEPGPKPLMRVPPEDSTGWDDPDSLFVVDAVCSALSASGAHFRVVGFFEKPLPTDVGSDLAVFISQLIELVEFLCLRSAPSIQIELGEQGIDTSLTFRHMNGKTVEVGCLTSRSGLLYSFESMPWSELARMIMDFHAAYQHALSELFPAAVDDSWHSRLLSACRSLRDLVKTDEIAPA